MVVYNYSGKEVNAKIVYYGPALSGKTTNLEWIYSKIPVEYSGKMVSLRTQADRTIFFDFLPLDLGMIDGFRTRFMLYTVPGQVHYNATRKMVLKGVDGLVFVADSEPGRMKDNIESLQNLRDNLTELGMNLDSMPLVIQWNKRDLPSCMTVAELETQLNPRGLPSFEACALTGEGVYETLHKVCRSIYTKLTGAQSGSGEEEPSLFGASIAQCLQDVDIPQPEPERVAIGVDGSSAPIRSVNEDPLGAILGRSSNMGSSSFGGGLRSSLPEMETPTTEIRPASGSARIAGHGAPPTDDLDEAQRLGGLVDEVLSSLEDHDDVASIDRASSRPVSNSIPKTSALGERLDHFFEGIETSRPAPVIRQGDDSAPVTSPWERSDMGSSVRSPGGSPPERDEMSVEHDVDVFEELGRGSSANSPVRPRASEPVVPVSADSGDDLDLDRVLREDPAPQGQDLELITDPRKLPRQPADGEASSGHSRPSLGTSDLGDGSVDAPTGVLEVPVRISRQQLERGESLKIVLNIRIGN